MDREDVICLLQKFQEEPVQFSLLAGAFACSILRSCEIRLHYPIAVLVKSIEEAEKVSKIWTMFGTEMIISNTPPKQFRYNVMDVHDDFVLILYSEGRYTLENMETIYTIVQSGGGESGKVHSVPIVFFTNIIPESYLDFFSVMIDYENHEFITKDTKKLFQNEMRNFIVRNFSEIQYELKKIVTHEKLKDARDAVFFIAASKILELYIEGRRPENEVRCFQYFEHKWIEQYRCTEYFLDGSYVAEVFVNELQRLVSESVILLSHKNALKLMGESERDSLLLYDDKYYFVNEGLFRKICLPLKQLASTNQTKIHLERAGILCSHGGQRKYRTQKLRIKASETEMRFVWLRRSEIDKDILTPTLIERAGSKGEEYIG